MMMILGALAISTAVASAKRAGAPQTKLSLRECNRYGLDYHKTMMAQAGDEFGGREVKKRRWWDYAGLCWRNSNRRNLYHAWGSSDRLCLSLAMNLKWVAGLAVVLVSRFDCLAWMESLASNPILC